VIVPSIANSFKIYFSFHFTYYHSHKQILSSLNFPKVNIGLINLPLKYHCISLKYTWKSYESQSTIFQGQLILYYLRLPRYQIKIPLFCVCFNILLPLPDYTLVTFKCNIYCCITFIFTWVKQNQCSCPAIPIKSL
jgi:hypothetical protein